MGASEFLNRRVNEEFQRAFEAGIASSEVYPSAEIYYIGTPSERPTSEGFRSAVSHGTSSVDVGCCRHFDTARTSFEGSS